MSLLDEELLLSSDVVVGNVVTYTDCVVSVSVAALDFCCSLFVESLWFIGGTVVWTRSTLFVIAIVVENNKVYSSYNHVKIKIIFIIKF